jgi:hypothetical protein|tara:strand:+ start:684 stop:1262 length:579 start_codon:yes stop_codon:yes gene_type:complete
MALKKEFSKKDVRRMRNLITGNAGASSDMQIGYKKKEIDYKEGDIWVEDKRTWTIKNGIKQTISKLDAVKKEVFMPLCCPECSRVMKKRLDKPNYNLHKKCFDCVIDFEGKLRLRGEYDDYLKNLENKNKIDILNETELYLLDVVNNTNEGYVSEHGDVERWKGGIDKIKMTAEIKKNAQIGRDKLEKEAND